MLSDWYVDCAPSSSDIQVARMPRLIQHKSVWGGLEWGGMGRNGVAWSGVGWSGVERGGVGWRGVGRMQEGGKNMNFSGKVMKFMQQGSDFS